MFSFKETILQGAEDMPAQTSKTIVCPQCSEDWIIQGQPLKWRPKRSMSITRTPFGVIYNCFRASCSKGGYYPMFHVKPPERASTGFKPAVYAYNLKELTKVQKQFFYLMYGLDSTEVEEAHFKYNPSKNTFALPILDNRGSTIGIVDRDFTGRREPKALSYWFHDVSKLYFTKWWDTLQSSTVILVEDILSAIKVNRYYPGVALLGTALNDDKIIHLSDYFNKVILALDPDAIKKAMKLKKKYEGQFESFEVKLLKKDPKDMSDEELDEVFK